MSVLAGLGDQTPSVILTSDASGGWECGAFYEGHWFQLAWKDTRGVEGLNIATKELISIVIAIALWGRNWTGQVVQCRCDNSAVVAVLASQTRNDQDLMYLIRCLAPFEAKLSVRVIGAHLPGAQNTLADNLSRNPLSSFLQASSRRCGHASGKDG